MIDKSVMHFLSNRRIEHYNRKDVLGILQKFKLQQEKKSSQILVSAVIQREFTFPCLSKLFFKASMVISKKIELDFVLSGTRVMDRIICYCIILLLRKACQSY